ncbi:MAG: fatty acid desaturase family protein [Candidatus Binatia bacterium]
MIRTTPVTEMAPPTLSGLTEAACRRRFASAFRPRPVTYWSDLLLSVSIGWTAFALSGLAPFGSPSYVIVTVITILALLRSTLFIHELAHCKRGTLLGFETTWNLLVGLPLMLPSLMYVGSHGDHHRQSVFGTPDDPEYAPLARWGRVQIAGFIAFAFVIPFLLVIRWGVLSPLSWLIPPLRRLVVAQASTLVINTHYRRPAPLGRHGVRWILQEVAVASVFWVVVTCAIVGWLSVRWLWQWYVVGVGILLVNQVRTLAAHRYDNDGKRRDAIGQLLDSINLRGRPILTVLAAPLGLRYHALHHFLPTVPYHSLGALHRQLLTELPADSLYRRTERSGILAVVRDLFRREKHIADPAIFSEGRAARET